MTAATTQEKPRKPWLGFPLTAHGGGQWAKKINGKRHYFGVWADPDAAYAKFKQQFPYLVHGITPPDDDETIGKLLNLYDDKKSKALLHKKIGQRTYDEYMAVAKVIGRELGETRVARSVRQLDLERVGDALAIGRNGQPISPVTHKRLLTFARMIFRWANRTFDNVNFKYEDALKSPEKKLIREQRAKAGSRMFEATDLRKLIKAADPTMKAVILMGLNCGFGPTDVIELTTDRIKNGFVDYPRPKTAVNRRCPLWQQTLKAIEAIQGDGKVLNVKVGERGRERKTWNRHMLARDFRASLRRVQGRQQRAVQLTENFRDRRQMLRRFAVGDRRDPRPRVACDVRGLQPADLRQPANQMHRFRGIVAQGQGHALKCVD